MNYSEIIQALDMVWEDKPRLDILACREEAYNLLDPALQDLSEFTWNSLQEQLIDNVAELGDEDIADIEEAVTDSVGFGVDIYLSCILASTGRLVSTGHKSVQTDEVLKVIEKPELQVTIMERFELVPLILRDFAQERLEALIAQISGLAELPWELVDSLRQSILALATTTFLISAVHLENSYPAQAE
ncbi:MAG: hypothetical protein M0Z55_07510 [Peptococcaceae bacterium]|nr:hypothetical protein [Peptococcaceae bacterium]